MLSGITAAAGFLVLYCLPGLPDAKSAACSAALSATRKEERKK